MNEYEEGANDFEEVDNDFEQGAGDEEGANNHEEPNPNVSFKTGQARHSRHLHPFIYNYAKLPSNSLFNLICHNPKSVFNVTSNRPFPNHTDS
ncbi:hypothetical protein L1987_69628 [Smallanthus sonchifolius]|uniref:Uncharacterized protein n=1 Tax=Smallanthus sonchifolius TaxID=185202 RepID=A0ACB9B780_9ASTR|nr:hypothetical protein L1987_69628 [Smallanthus sonchifolius]